MDLLAALPADPSLVERPMIRLLVLLPVLAFTAIMLAWASEPIAAAMAPTVAAGVADGLRLVAGGCAGALVVLAGFAGCIGLCITASTRADRQWVRYVEAPPARPALPETRAIDTQWYEVKEYQDVE
jgi:hypothetical protein